MKAANASAFQLSVFGHGICLRRASIRRRSNRGRIRRRSCNGCVASASSISLWTKAAYAAATCPWLRQTQIWAAAVLFESEHSPMQERAQRKQARNSSQNIERSKAGIQSLPWRNRASRSRRVSTKLHHQVFHRTDEILLRYTSGSIRIERIPNRACALRCEHCRRAERLKCLIELRLID